MMWTKKTKFLIILTLVELSLAFYSNHDEPVAELDDSKSSLLSRVQEQWISQKLDHFDESDVRVWNMRYLQNDGYLVKGGPIFIIIGGEWTISSAWLVSGHVQDMAREMSGIVFYTEHRFYGKSHPTNNTSTDNLKYLTVQQALADLAHFIEHVKSSRSDLSESRVIVTGMSYSATMATWMRLKYPQLVDGAWASSAPLHAKLDFFEYNEVMTDSVRRVGGVECLERFERAFKQLEEMVESASPRMLRKIERSFNLCEPLDLTRDTNHFFYELSDTVAALVQGHRNRGIQLACNFISDSRFADDVQALGKWVQSKHGKKCIDMNYAKLVAKFTNVSWEAEANTQLRQWIYQTCDSFAWFQSGTSRNQSFGFKFRHLDYFVEMCKDFYGDRFTKEEIQRNVERTNEEFGSFNPQITNVYSTHGSLDPWKAMGASTALNEHSPTFVIDLYAHCSDLNSISYYDSEEMKSSKIRVKEYVKKWLKL